VRFGAGGSKAFLVDHDFQENVKFHVGLFDHFKLIRL